MAGIQQTVRPSEVDIAKLAVGDIMVFQAGTPWEKEEVRLFEILLTNCEIRFKSEYFIADMRVGVAITYVPKRYVAADMGEGDKTAAVLMQRNPKTGIYEYPMDKPDCWL